MTRLSPYFSMFFRQDGKERAALITKAGRPKPGFCATAFGRKNPSLALCEQRRAILSRDRTRALLTLSVEVINRYAAEKNRRSLLDYDDLIGRARDLLENTNAAWVHYKLDLGIDHILIDEAQDTSPAQWDIIIKFVSEFTAGAGARSTIERTIFAVGDEKQSIFSFQGAAPKAFDEKKRFFEKAHRDASKPFLPVPMLHSFRSVPAVLKAVDWVFKDPLARQGLGADPAETLHTAVRENAPGLVEIWNLIEPEEKKRSRTLGRAFRPRNLDQSAGEARAADRSGGKDLAHTRRACRRWSGSPPVRAGDILILVRQRGPLFEAIIRQLKNADIPAAGADRLILTEHIAIMDLLTLADVVLHPRDDLALATMLKSPIFGLSEEELLSLAREA